MKVSILKASDYTDREIQRVVDAHFSLLGADRDIRRDMKVLLKPNLVMKRDPESATTTHPAFVKAVIRHLEGLGVTDITVADSPGGLYSRAALSGIYDTCGMAGAVAGTCAKLNLDTTSGTRAADSRLVPEFPIITPVLQADYIISLPKLKTHCMTGLSGGVKNLFGVIPGLTKPEFHYRFSENARFCSMLVDLAGTVSPSLTIVDAVDSMEGDGPSAGIKKYTGLSFAGKDPFFLDRILLEYIGMPVSECLTVHEAIQRSLCPSSAAQIPVCGDFTTPPRCGDFRMPRSKHVDFGESIPGFVRKPALYLANRLLTPRPVIRHNNCIGCGKCAQSCPAKTIRIQKKKARIDYRSCIHCFCCHEMCPVSAIHIRRSPLSR